MSALQRIARDASALPLAGGCVTVTWCDERGAWHTAFVDDVTGIPAATLATVAVARDGRIIEVETTVHMEEIA
jgi:hypothetical protein